MWRETASSQAQADLDELITAGLKVAQEKLAKHGEFHPFGGALKLDGAIHFIASQMMIPEGEQPNLEDLRALCRATLHRKRDLVRAAGVVSLKTGEKAILIELDHSEGVSFSISIPYERGFFNHKVKLGDPVAGPASPFVWT